MPDRDMRLTADPATGLVPLPPPGNRLLSAALASPDALKLRRLREESGLSVRQLSRQAELSESTIRKAENPRPWESVTVGTLQLLAEVYGVDWRELALNR